MQWYQSRSEVQEHKLLRILPLTANARMQLRLSPELQPGYGPSGARVRVLNLPVPDSSLIPADSVC